MYRAQNLDLQGLVNQPIRPIPTYPTPGTSVQLTNQLLNSPTQTVKFLNFLLHADTFIKTQIEHIYLSLIQSWYTKQDLFGGHNSPGSTPQLELSLLNRNNEVDIFTLLMQIITFPTFWNDLVFYMYILFVN